MKKIFAAFVIFLFFVASLFAQSEPNGESESASVKDVVISAGDVCLVNMIFNSCARIVLEEEYSQTTLSTMKENLKSRWVWDKDGYFMNQFGHPYQGSLYYGAGRSNGLDFWQSFFIAAGGSFLWEELGETTTPSVNDIITTPICGAIVGETLHRLYLDANELIPALAWLLSPADGLNSAIKNKRTYVSGRTEEIDFIFHGGMDHSFSEVSDSLDSEHKKKSAGGCEFHIQYGVQDAHTSKEPFDLFTAYVDLSASSQRYYNIDFSIDGFLYSHALYFEESEGTLGVNLMYDGKKTKDTAFSNAAVGVKYIGTKKASDSDGIFRFSAQLDGIFMGTRSLYPIMNKVKVNLTGPDKLNPPRYYDFTYGILAKAGFLLGNSFFGTLYGDVESSFVLPYPSSELEEAEGEKHFLIQTKLGYEHKIAKHFTLGLRDSFIYKVDCLKNEIDSTQKFNTAQIYVKIVFARD